MNEPVLKQKDSATKIMERIDRYHEAITYAEANMPEEAVAVLADMKKEPSMILVLGRGYDFSESLKDYSIGLAKRLGYEILAVSTKYIPEDFLPLVSGYRETLRKDFTSKAKDAAEEFRKECEAASIPFFHSIEFDDSMKVVKKLHRIFKQLEYVVTEPDDEVEISAGVSRAIPVFSLAAG
jgi:hypothetical protein